MLRNWLGFMFGLNSRSFGESWWDLLFAEPRAQHESGPWTHIFLPQRDMDEK